MVQKQPKFLRLSNLEGLTNAVDEKINLSLVLDIDDSVGREIKLLRKARDKNWRNSARKPACRKVILAK